MYMSVAAIVHAYEWWSSHIRLVDLLPPCSGLANRIYPHTDSIHTRPAPHATTAQPVLSSPTSVFGILFSTYIFLSF